MPSLKEVRTRIESVKSTQQITSAMKMVAASKLRRAQNAILQLRPYASKLQEILQNLTASLEGSDEGVYSDIREGGKVLLVVISSNRGLCGGFNSNIIKETINQLNTTYRELLEAGNVDLMTVGRKGSEFFVKNKFNVVSVEDEIFNDMSFANVSELAQQLMDDYLQGKYDKIEIVYNQFKNAAVQNLLVEQFLPVEAVESELEDNIAVDFLFEPDKEQIVSELIPRSLKIQFFKAVLDSYASEQGARMTAMHTATENASELIKELKLTYNKARQADITKEILEIVSGAEALKNA